LPNARALAWTRSPHDCRADMTGVLIRLLRDLRLVPIVLIATIALFALKTLGLVLDGGYLFDSLTPQKDRDNFEVTGTIAAPGPRAPTAGAPATQPLVAGKNLAADKNSADKKSWAQEMFSNPDGTGAVAPPPGAALPPIPAIRPSAPSSDITGAVNAPPPSAPPKEEATPAKAEPPKAKVQEPPPAPNGTAVSLDVDRPVSQAERAVLESLQKRRAELDARARELDVREDLLRAAEKRVGGRIEELKDLEARVDAAMQKRDEGETARLKNVVAMYENMKAKDAAKIFDGLDIRVLLEVVKEINPRRMSDILALMAPENAQRLTIELAARTAQKDPTQAAELPKIQGQPNPN
jgi:flagellar motility protein MotE (MotC chaperone)